MRIAGWITKATDKHSEYEIFIAFKRQKWLRERTWMFPDTHVACVVLLLVKLLTEVTYQPNVVSDSIHVFRQSICTLTCLVRYLLLKFLHSYSLLGVHLVLKERYDSSGVI
jgi:hypothetical protein